MIALLWSVYFYTLLIAFVTTLLLILCGYSWGELPHHYLKLVGYLQGFFSEDGVVLPSIERSPSSTYKWLFGRALSSEDGSNSLDEELDNNTGSCSSSEKLDTAFSDMESVSVVAEIAVPGGVNSDSGKEELANPFEWNLELIRDGIESIIQDDISEIFAQSAAYRNAEPRSLRDLFFYYKHERKRRRNLQKKREQLKNDIDSTIVEEDESCDDNFVENGFLAEEIEKNLSPPKFRPFLRSCLLLLVSRFFRGGILFPIRFALLCTSFIYLITFCTLAWFIDFTDRGKTKIAVIYCRLFTAGTGLIARYHNIQNRPTRPGVAVANHLSPNDIQIICADVEPYREYLYIVTGQKHNGIIWAIEHFVEKLCPSIWLERSSAEDRKKFTKSVLDVAKVSGPILIFPEGYCTNNQKVLQFRRAVFDEGITIHPIAIRQDARFGDSYWSEDFFFNYLRRILTSWAIVYDVIYLPSETRKLGETSTEFAARIQNLIAKAVGVECANFDGGLYYKKKEREKYKAVWMEECGKRVESILKVSNYSSSYSSSVSDNASTDGTDDKFVRCEITNSGMPEFRQNKVLSRLQNSANQSDIADDLISVSRSETDASLTDQDSEASLIEDGINKNISISHVESQPKILESNGFRQRKSTVGANTATYKVLERRRYNSLSLIQRQVSIEDDLNG